METSKKKLTLRKEQIARFDEMKNVKGGYIVDGRFTSGCTDGCGPLKTAFNCTQNSCTADCGTNACDTQSFCTTVAVPVETVVNCVLTGANCFTGKPECYAPTVIAVVQTAEC